MSCRHSSQKEKNVYALHFADLCTSFYGKLLKECDAQITKATTIKT